MNESHSHKLPPFVLTQPAPHPHNTPRTRSHELGGGHDDPRFPSFFEVFMQDRIDQSLKPAARHVAVVLAERCVVHGYDEL